MSEHAIKLEAFLYLQHRQLQFPFDEAFFKEFYQQLEPPLSNRLPAEAKFISEIRARWNQQADSFLWKHWSTEPEYLGTAAWGCTDLLLAFSESRGVRVGIELSRVDANLHCDLVELSEQAGKLLKKMQILASHLRSASSDDVPDPCVVLAVELNRQDAAAREWAHDVLDGLFQLSLLPAMQEVEVHQQRRFVDTLFPPLRTQGLALDWSVASETNEVLLRAHGGARQLKSAGPSSDMKAISHIFWARQGGVIGQVFPSGRPSLPSSRSEVFSNAVAAFRADFARRRIHFALRKAEYRLVRKDISALEKTELSIAYARKLAANLKRYTLNTRKAFMDLGVQHTTAQSNGLLDYFEETHEQLLAEADRFTPEAEQVAAEVERSGGILGWPGFILAGSALVLAALDTWWGVVGSVVPQERMAKSGSLALASTYAIGASLSFIAFIFLYLARRELRLRNLGLRRSGVEPGLMGNFGCIQAWFLALCGVAFGLVAFASVYFGGNLIGPAGE